MYKNNAPMPPGFFNDFGFPPLEPFNLGGSLSIKVFLYK